MISDNAIDFIKKEEGCVLHAYQDSAGVWTIGIGSTYYGDGKKPKPGDTISMQKAEDMLKRDLENKADSIRSMLVNTKLNQNQFDALLSFTYNCGTEALRNSTLIKKVRNNPNDPTIRDAFIMWNKITKDGKKVVSEDLTERRRREADLYFKPIS